MSPIRSLMAHVAAPVLLGALLLAGPLRAQQGLPHALDPSEVPLIRDYRDSRAAASRGTVTPPVMRRGVPMLKFPTPCHI